jgi:hypothetical protein
MPHYHHADSGDCDRCTDDSYAYYGMPYIYYYAYLCVKTDDRDDRDDPCCDRRRLQ